MRALGADLPKTKLPASCQACGKVDLWPANHEAWAIYCQYPSLIRCGMDGWRVDIPAALQILDRLYVDNPLLMIRRFEALKSGFSSK